MLHDAVGFAAVISMLAIPVALYRRVAVSRGQTVTAVRNLKLCNGTAPGWTYRARSEPIRTKEAKMPEQPPHPDSQEPDPKLEGSADEDERLEDLEPDDDAADDVQGGAHGDEWRSSATPSPN